jgi:hypothetical protein
MANVMLKGEIDFETELKALETGKSGRFHGKA